MSVRFTCPHCRALTFIEADRVGQTGPCRSCGRPVTVMPSTVNDPQQPNYPDTSQVLKTTASGSGIGCCLAAILTIAFLAIPVFLPLLGALVSGIGGLGNDEMLHRALAAQAKTLAISCALGLAAGATLMGISAALFRDSPRLLQHAKWGALLGAIAGPLLIFLLFSLPLIIQSGLGNVRVHAQMQAHWFFSLIACAVGAVAGLLLNVLLGVVTGPGTQGRCNTR